MLPTVEGVLGNLLPGLFISALVWSLGGFLVVLSAFVGGSSPSEGDHAAVRRVAAVPHGRNARGKRLPASAATRREERGSRTSGKRTEGEGSFPAGSAQMSICRTARRLECVAAGAAMARLAVAPPTPFVAGGSNAGVPSSSSPVSVSGSASSRPDCKSEGRSRACSAL